MATLEELILAKEPNLEFARKLMNLESLVTKLTELLSEVVKINEMLIGSSEDMRVFVKALDVRLSKAELPR